MKNVLPLLLLCLVLVLPGCLPSGSSSCTYHNLTPGATYRAFYNFPSYPPPPPPVTRVADANGNITVPKNGYDCATGINVQPVLNSNLSLAASPGSVYLPDPPATTTITGQSFDATYGMPKVEYVDSYGFLIGEVSASSVSSDGTSLQANTPDLSQVYSGTYQVRVTNKTSGGYYVNIVGAATINAWGRDRLDSDGDGWYDDEDCDPYNPQLTNYCSGSYCGGGSEPITLCS